jgi:hypothetical protein
MKTFKQFLQEEEEIGTIYAKQLGDVPAWHPDLAEGNYHVGEVTFSSKDGLGSVPFNQSVYYHGFVTMLKPSAFAELALEDDSTARAKGIAKMILKGYAVGIPFFNVSLGDEDNGPAKITGHEGRARMLAVKMANGDVPVPVHCFLQHGLRARDLTPDRIDVLKRGVFAERSQNFVLKAFSTMYVNGKKV